MATLGTKEYTQELIKRAQALGANASGFFSTQTPPKTNSVAKPGALEKLSNTPAFQLGPQSPGIVPQVYSSSLGGPTPSTSSGGKQDYTQPIGQYTPSTPTNPSTYQPSAPVYNAPPPPPPAPQPTNIFSSATSALKRAASGIVGGLTKFGEFLTSPSSTPNQSIYPASAIQGFQQAQQATQAPATTTPTLASGAGATAATDTGGVQQNLGSSKSYQIDTKADATTQRTQLDTSKKQEDALKQVQIQSIQSRLSELVAQRDALIAAGQTPEQTPEAQTPDQFGLPATQQYNPEAQAGISGLSDKIRQFEEEIAALMQESPEYTAAKQAVEAKEAEEAQIKANLQKGQANVAEQPIAYSFISGQQAALERRAQADLGNVYAAQIPLQQRLATEQAKKQSAIDVAKTKYGYLGDARERAEDVYRTNYERSIALADAQAEQQRKLALEAAKPKTTSSTTQKEVYDGNTILSGIQKDLIADIQNGGSLTNLYRAYPEVQRLYIEELFRRFSPSKSGVIGA